MLSVCRTNADAWMPVLSCTTWLTRPSQDNQLEAQPGSRLPTVIDSHGREVDRNALVAREQTVRGGMVDIGICCEQ